LNKNPTNWAAGGLLSLVLIVGCGAYFKIVSQYAALERQLNQIRPLPAASIAPPPEPAGNGREAALIALDARIDPLLRRLSALQEEVTRLNGRMDLLAAWQQAAAGSPGGGPAPSPPDIPTPEEKRVKAPYPSPAERAQELWERYSQEERSEAWAFGVEAAIQSAFSTIPELANVRIGELDCRTSMCRLTWEFAEDLNSEDYFILENEMVAALGAAGLSQGSQIGTGNEIEGYFFRKEPPSEPPPRRE
jgi:hypothetical protein